MRTAIRSRIGRTPILLAGFLAGIFYVSACGGGSGSGVFSVVDTPAVAAGTCTGTRITALPFTITAPGHYYVADTLTGISGSHGILVHSSDVTINLNGNLLLGVPGSRVGITNRGAGMDPTNLRICNGCIRAWGGEGIDLFNTRSGVMDSIRVEDCAGHGIAFSNGVIMHDCHASGNGQGGITVGSDCIVRDCTANSNGEHGFSSGPGSVLTRCNAFGNTLSGFDLRGGRASHCLARNNKLHGMEVTATVVTDCSLRRNDGNGVRVTTHATIRGCQIAENLQIGLVSFGQALIQGNYFYRNDRNAGQGSKAVRLESAGARLDGNHFVEHAIGIQYVPPNDDHLVVRNSFLAVTTPIMGATTSSSVGPLRGHAALATDDNPHANLFH